LSSSFRPTTFSSQFANSGRETLSRHFILFSPPYSTRRRVLYELLSVTLLDLVPRFTLDRLYSAPLCFPSYICTPFFLPHTRFQSHLFLSRGRGSLEGYYAISPFLFREGPLLPEAQEYCILVLLLSRVQIVGPSDLYLRYEDLSFHFILLHSFSFARSSPLSWLFPSIDLRRQEGPLKGFQSLLFFLPSLPPSSLFLFIPPLHPKGFNYRRTDASLRIVPSAQYFPSDPTNCPFFLFYAPLHRVHAGVVGFSRVSLRYPLYPSLEA